MTTLDLFVLLQTCSDTLCIADGAGVFRYTKECRADTVGRLLQELRNEQRPTPAESPAHADSNQQMSTDPSKTKGIL